MQSTVTRKIFGQQISYNLAIEKNPISKQLHIKVECLQPRLFQQMLGNSPELFRNQLLQVATDAAYSLNSQAHFEEPLFISASEKDVCMQARFCLR